MLAVVWPFGFSARFADPGGTQTRKAQTMRAFPPGSAALLGHTTRLDPLGSYSDAGKILKTKLEYSNVRLENQQRAAP